MIYTKYQNTTFLMLVEETKQIIPYIANSHIQQLIKHDLFLR